MQIKEGKKELIYYKEVDTGRLMQELYDAISELKPIINNDGSFEINLRVFTNGNKLILWVLDSVYEELVRQVVENHVLVIEKAGEE